MIQELKDKILSIKPTFSSSSNSTYPLPDEVYVYYQEDDFLVDITLDVNDVLCTDVMVAEEDYNLTDSDINFIFKYAQQLLDDEIKLTKQYYEAERYERQETYFIR